MLQPLSSQLITLSLDNKTKQWWICLSEKGRQITLSVVWLTISQTDRNALLIVHSAQQGGDHVLMVMSLIKPDKSWMYIGFLWRFWLNGFWMQHLDIIFIMFLILVLSDFKATKYIYSNVVLVRVWLHLRGQLSHCSLDYICLTALAIYTSYLSKECFFIHLLSSENHKSKFGNVEFSWCLFLHWLRELAEVVTSWLVLKDEDLLPN